jgi:hypothetical protein
MMIIENWTFFLQKINGITPITTHLEVIGQKMMRRLVTPLLNKKKKSL